MNKYLQIPRLGSDILKGSRQHWKQMGINITVIQNNARLFVQDK